MYALYTTVKDGVKRWMTGRQTEVDPDCETPGTALKV